jgi:hypothetical protein
MRQKEHQPQQNDTCRSRKTVQTNGTRSTFCQFMRDNRLSNRIFKSYDDIVDPCCDAWNTLIDQPWKIMSIAMRDWAYQSSSPSLGIRRLL